MARIRPILEGGKGGSNSVSLNTVNQWMTDLREIPYGYALFWKTPVETISGAPADCKAKSVALYERMKAAGATNLRLVIGKRTPTSKISHAWLAWDSETAATSLILLSITPPRRPIRSAAATTSLSTPTPAARNSARVHRSSLRTKRKPQIIGGKSGHLGGAALVFCTEAAKPGALLKYRGT